MLRQLSRRFLLAITVIVAVLVFSGTLFAQGRSAEAFERVKQVQAAHTQRLMAIKDVEGTAIGLDENDEYALKIFTARPGIGGIPRMLGGVPVRVVITGKFYALPKPSGKPGGDGKPVKLPKAPTGLTATAVSESQIDLDWNDSRGRDILCYNVFRNGAPIASPTNSIHSDSDDLTASTTYRYFVTAVYATGESSPSNEVWATTLGESQPVLDPSDRFPRPIPIGVSTGHPLVTAGTIGCRLTDGPRVYALSNNHIYANSNRATIGDIVLQPGTIDGGNSTDAIGTLTAFVPIVFFDSQQSITFNTIDAAIALSTTANLGNATQSDGYGQPSSTTTTAFVGMEVQKYGRTTGLTAGYVSEINATIAVGYDDVDGDEVDDWALFWNQIVIMPGAFSAGGDSGSLIVTDDEACNPVGLLFAGSATTTIANPIDAVLDAFSGMSIDGK